MSSLGGSMNIAVTALQSQSAAVSTISNNLANSETVGYKTTSASFYTLVTGSGSTSNFTGAGTLAQPTQNISLQGQLVSSDVATSLAIDGNGFFAVTATPDSDVLLYTRAGDFTTDADGDLVNSNGFYLQGYRTDQDGNPISGTGSAALETINIGELSGTAVATSELALEANLPATAEIGDSYSVSTEIYDSLGVAHSLSITYEKTAANTWSMTVSDPTQVASGAVSGTASGGGTITFNEDGTFASSVPDPLDIAIVDWTTGAADSAIAFDAGTAGRADGLTQYAPSSSDSIQIEVSEIDQDGVPYGDFESVEIDESGLVIANFSNGISYPIYQIPLATFANADGLEAKSGNVYATTNESGSATLVLPGTGGAGSIFSNALESSTVDTADEFTNLIRAQQAYSAASEIISTVQDMFDTLIRAKS